MKQQIRLLLDLQDYDARLIKLKKELDALPTRLDEMQRDLAQLEQVVEQARSELETEVRWKQEKEEENRFIEAQVQGLRTKINSSRGHREVVALQRQLDTSRKQSSDLEEEILQAMEAIEQRRGAIAEHEKSLGAIKEALAKEEALIRAEMAELTETANKERRAREERLTGLDDSVRSRYDKLAGRRHPSIVEAVEGRCTGCNMSLRPQLYNILHYGNTLEVCPTCGRLIFIRSAVFGEEESDA